MTGGQPDAAEIVVIGGGAMGASTLYHLAALGASEPLLLERDKLTSGTSWHSAAQVRALRSTESLTRLIQYSTSLYQRLEAETGQSTGWLETGSLSLATRADRLTHLRRQASLARAFGLEVEMVDAAEAGRLWPLMRTDDVVGAAFSPSDGRVNPSDLCAAFVRGARARGARVMEDTPVTGFRIRNRRVRGVETRHGVIECRAAVVCAGLWSRRLAALAGARAPLYACEHFYLLTAPIPGVDGHLPTLGDHDGHLYLRDDVGGLLVGCFEPHAKALALEDLPSGFSFDLLAEDWEHFEPMLENAIHRVPALAEAEARMLLNGPESFTPDGGFLLGAAPEVDGLYLGCGMNSMGLASSGGAGWALAEWIVNGRPSLDLSPVDVRRFGPAHNNLRFLAARAPEVLSLHYAIAYPGREHATGRGLRRSPLHDRMTAAGAVFGERGGWERPAWFGARGSTPPPLTFGRPSWDDEVAAEHRAVRETVALIDQSSFGKLLVQGRDACAGLQRICANDVAVAPGRCVYTGLLNRQGGYESDVVVLRLAEDAYLLVTGSAQATRDEAWIRRCLGESGDALCVTVADVSSGWAVLGVHGPRSRALLQRVSPSAFDDGAFPYFSWQPIEVGDGLARAVRVSYAGELGWELHVPAEMATGVYDAVVAAGGDLGLRHAGTEALASLRLEKGYRAWGADLTPADTPFEAGLAFAVRLDKPSGFIGQAALRERRDAPLRRRLVSLVLDDPEARAQGGEPIVCDGRYVGQVTSAAFGHTVERTVALGAVRAEDGPVDALIAAGRFEVEIALERFAARVSRQAPYDPEGTRIRSAG